NASLLRRNFEGSSVLYVPKIYWDWCRHKVLVMGLIKGIPVTDIDTLKAQGTDMKKLAERGVEVFFAQVFRDSFFHADMHPGNIFVAHGRPDDPQYIAIDFGIVGSLTPEDQTYLARNLMAFFKRDYRRVAQLHIDSGWVPPETRVNEFEAAIRSVCEPIFERPLKDISFGQLLLRLFQTARRFNMEVQPQLVLLQKTLLNIEGLGRQLYPELDLWRTGKPYLERWMRERASPRRQLHTLRQHMERIPPLLQTTHRALDNIARWEHHPQARRSDARALRLLGAALLALGASSLGSDVSLWPQTPPAYWLSLAAGLWLVLRR
ncbi:MAG: ubiquinone biosynthesis regulatory protein kinase UbiB, partial [Gammaproteobacteria bacterium]|nr:ubiquinone biosynthesis regulatory protein kinase UbiB [Gammaproteobacteria bacterium]